MGRCTALSPQQCCVTVITSLLLYMMPSSALASIDIVDSGPVEERTLDPSTSSPTSGKDRSLVETIQWLNTVTAKATDELNEMHPPPLKDLVANAGSSNVVQEIQGVTKVFGNVASDLKDGFVGLKGTIKSLGTEQNVEDSGVESNESPTEVDAAKPVTKTAAV